MFKYSAARVARTILPGAAARRCLVPSVSILSSTLAPVSSVTNASSVCIAMRFCSTNRGSNTSATAAQQEQQAMGGDVDDMEETHPDFQPRVVASDLAEDEIATIKKDIDDTIKEEDIVVFIKGVPEAPMCAFSKKMIDVLEALGVEYTSFDVLAHPVVRTYVKEVSEWPTVPQLFVKGDFAGGVDIVLKMAEQGDLQMLLDEKGIKHRAQKK